MAGFKHRYLVLKLDGIAPVSEIISNFIQRRLRADFGEYALGLIDIFEVVEVHKRLGMALIRCNLQIYKYIAYVLITSAGKKEDGIRIQIMTVSGILKKARKKMLNIINHEETDKIKC